MKVRELRKLLEDVSGESGESGELDVLVAVGLSEWSVKSGHAQAHVRGARREGARIYIEADENEDCAEWK